MRLFESIVEANHRAVSGDSKAGIKRSDFASSLPAAALTCIDPRLNPLIPEVLGILEEDFIWLRNAGNIITGSSSSTVRSLALAVAVKGAKEIVILGHTDCRIRQVTTMELTTRFQALGISRNQLPENITQFFGLFASERQNVLTSVDFVRNSPVIGPAIPVHGLLLDINTGCLEWIVNGYDVLATTHAVKEAPQSGFVMSQMDTEIGCGDRTDMGSPTLKIGDISMPAWHDEKPAPSSGKPSRPALWPVECNVYSDAPVVHEVKPLPPPIKPSATAPPPLVKTPPNVPVPPKLVPHPKFRQTKWTV